MAHRAGLSETILVFAQHRAFLSGLDTAALVARARVHSPEKFVLIEAESAEDALAAARAGADGVQLDKMSAVQLADLVPQLRALQPRPTINAVGGIRPDNAAEYAASGVDILVTSSLYNTKAADFGAVMRMDSGLTGLCSGPLQQGLQTRPQPGQDDQADHGR